jgi:hypothetical protein
MFYKMGILPKKSTIREKVQEVSLMKSSIQMKLMLSYRIKLIWYKWSNKGQKNICKGILKPWLPLAWKEAFMD